MVTSPSTTPKGLTNGTNVDSRAATSPASTTTTTLPPHQSSATTTTTAGVTAPTTTAGASASGGSNRLSPNIWVNQGHHLHPNVSINIWTLHSR